MILVAAALLQVQPIAIRFAPPLDAPLRVTVERTDSGAGARRFAMDRLIRFTREGGGYRADVRVLTSAGSGPPPLGGMVEAGFAALRGIPIVLHLDPQGEVTDIEDMAALWERLCAGVAAVVARRPGLEPSERDALAARVAAPLRALPPDRQRALLGSLVTAAIAGDGPATPGTTPIRLPGVSPFGQPVQLNGTRETRADGSTIVQRTQAAADLVLPAADQTPMRSGRIVLEQRRTLDAGTGLLRASDETVRTRADDGSETRETVRATRLRVEPAAPDAWRDAGRH